MSMTICIHATFHMCNSNGSLVIVIKRKDHLLHVASKFRFILYRKKRLHVLRRSIIIYNFSTPNKCHVHHTSSCVSHVVITDCLPMSNFV